MKITPKNKELKKYIDYYWIVKDSKELFANTTSVLAYPGISPELIIILEGYLTFSYENKMVSTSNSILESHIKRNFTLYPHTLRSFIFVRFKSKSLASLIPFLNESPSELIKVDLSDANKVFGKEFKLLTNHLRNLYPEDIANVLDQWFYSKLNRRHNGFVTEFFEEIGYTNTLKELKEYTNYSYSTLERYFKKETGMTPKKFQTLKRYKGALEEIYDTNNNDWFHYISKYGYHDQSHFIKEIKKFTSFTPEQLLHISSLRTFR
ncbi:helix-turn-helix domain-containing protein [Winogradskyella flava]|uniref:helix-turn-helix domain-containing protein n=1 Tax=Winogradskyella flava TaxID=1884876 RepID=UPI0024914446|nr:helix-turn-helix domain-containing protein [Winogradskyella flava]